LIAIGVGWIALSLTGSLTWLFASLGFALAGYVLIMAGAVGSGVWFTARRAAQ
jgi:hypothetical protein